ncbi:MAG TPA: serine/threonine-protein kinase [Pirellulales bacterium]|nr:serine/threonine-protein kinase [Pirellulales bacterium]
MSAMAELTAEQIAQRAFDQDLLNERQLQEIWGDFGRRNVPVDDFVQLLLRRELLTNFQLDRLLKGERAGFFYGDYKVLYMVAGGSFARVYRAVHKDTGVVRAVKVLRKRYSDSPEQTEHFCREGQVGITLRHPNIVPVYEVYSKGFTHFLVMEFVEGRNLREFVKIRKKLDPAEATRLMIDVVSGLRYAVEHGVSHRDLKLTNILVSSKGQAKLVDFGLAATDASVSEDVSGDQLNQRTIDYAGLERATGVRKDDARSDIYFLGCIYYHMLVGRAPLQETRDRIQRLSKARFQDVVPIHQADPSMPRVASAIVNQAMQLDVDRRYQSPAQMLVDLNIAAERLAAGDVGGADEGGDAAEQYRWQAERERIAAALLSDSQRRSIMFVESDSRMQDLIRDALKKAGYRVLVTSDPSRALQRFQDDKQPAECAIFSTGQLAQSAIDAFQSFAGDEQTKQIPALLLLGPDQGSWKSKVEASLAPHRVVASMPIKVRHLLEIIAKILPATPPAE